MASYGQVSKGSSGDDVLELQKILNQNGYNLTEDGIFGDHTLAAVKDYQTKNGLAVDGIVGKNTWGALTRTNYSDASASGATTNTNKTTGFISSDFTPSDTVTQANAALDAHIAAKPGEYTSQWQDKINGIIDQITNREKFSYDVNSDALYQQYKEQYASLGKLAMQDTMGQAAAMTGGYGNSYASTAGNQAYQSYLSQLNEVVPELYSMALDKYNAEGQELYNQYGLFSDQENQDYGKWVDKVNIWNSELDYLTGRADTLYNREYGEWSDKINLEYQDHINAIANEQWQKEMDLTEEQWGYQKKQLEDNNKSYSGTTSSGSSYNNGGLTDGQVKELQTALGVDADGKFGPKSKEAAGGLSAEEAYAKYVSGGSKQTSYITDYEKIQQWGDAILNSESQEEALRYVERLEQLDPDLADSYYEQWLKEHGKLLEGQGTEVPQLAGKPGTYYGNYTGGGGGGGNRLERKILE